MVRKVGNVHLAKESFEVGFGVLSILGEIGDPF
jgi:hypothetical protein